jgi:hypothetical protein
MVEYVLWKRGTLLLNSIPYIMDICRLGLILGPWMFSVSAVSYSLPKEGEYS